MLRLDHLSKSYDDHPVFQDLTHTFAPGCYALCEEASTGKSSLLAIIAGTLKFNGGEVWVDEHALSKAPKQVKLRVAYVPDDCLAFPMLTGRELLHKVAAEKNTTLDDAVLDLADRLGLEPHIDKRFEQMSTGTRRKVYLAACLIGHPAVIVADGPSNGLDAAAGTVLAEQLKTWGQDRVVLFSSHDAELVEACGATLVNIEQMR